jgi:transposase-like protein
MRVSKAKRGDGSASSPYFAFPPALRRAVYTTNQIESLNSVVRKAVRSRGHFPDDESARKLVYLRSETTNATGNAPWPAGTNASPPSTPTSRTD